MASPIRRIYQTGPVWINFIRPVIKSLAPSGHRHVNTKVTGMIHARKGHMTAKEKESPAEMRAPEVLTVDLRSDTITKPTSGMRKAMAEAEVGDDVYREDPTVKALQQRCAEMFGMEASLFVPSGTMGNLISLMVHCQERGSEVLLGNNTHLFLKEQGGMAQFGGICPRTLHNLPDGTFDLDELRSCIRTSNDPNQTKTKVICLENSHNFCGGRAMSLDFVKHVYAIARDHDLIVHTDGARILNSATALGVPVSDILQYSDTVNVCFSKGLSAPVGSIIGGNAEFIEKAIRLRKALGGGMRQIGILAAAALYSLDHIVPKLKEDHAKAKRLAQGMMAANSSVININLDGVDTNILTVRVIKPGVTAPMFCQRVRQITDKEESDLKQRISVKTNPMSPTMFRMLTHNDVSSEMINLAITKLQYVIQEYEQS